MTTVSVTHIDVEVSVDGGVAMVVEVPASIDVEVAVGGMQGPSGEGTMPAEIDLGTFN